MAERYNPPPHPQTQDKSQKRRRQCATITARVADCICGRLPALLSGMKPIDAAPAKAGVGFFNLRQCSTETGSQAEQSTTGKQTRPCSVTQKLGHRPSSRRLESRRDQCNIGTRSNSRQPAKQTKESQEGFAECCRVEMESGSVQSVSTVRYNYCHTT